MRVVVMALALAVMAPVALAQHGAQQGETHSLQGEQSAWINNAHMHSFYDLSKEMLGKGAASVDVDAYRDRSYAIFRAFGTSMGMSPDGMVDHLKGIPQQMVDIVRDDPKVLDSYDNFVVALMGPQ